MIKIQNFILFIILGCSQSFANPEMCKYFYALGSVRTSWTAEFHEELRRQDASLPIFVLDNYLKKRVAPITALYKKVIENIGRQGVDSKLQMKLKLLDKYFESTEKELTLLNAQLNETGLSIRKFWPFNRAESKESKLTQSIDSLKSCKLGLDDCVANFSLALKDSESFIKMAERLIEDVRHSSQRLSELSESLTGHPDNTFFQTILASHQGALDNIYQILDSSVTLEKQKIVTAILMNGNTYTLLQERFQLLLAEYAGNKQLASTNWDVRDENAHTTGSPLSTTYSSITNAGQQLSFQKIKTLELLLKRRQKS